MRKQLMNEYLPRVNELERFLEDAAEVGRFPYEMLNVVLAMKGRISELESRLRQERADATDDED